MLKLRKYDLNGESKGEVSVDEALFPSELSGQMLKDYIVAIRKNARQWSASTQGRSEVNHSKKKPHKQKGTGRARQGSLAAPQYKGGGVVFGPKPKFDQHVRINRKERQAVIKYLIGEKVRNNSVVILEDSKLEEPRTKTVASFLSQAQLQGRVLFLDAGKKETKEVDNKTVSFSVRSDQHDNLNKSIRNIPKVALRLGANVSGYDLLLANNLVITEGSWNELMEKWK